MFLLILGALLIIGGIYLNNNLMAELEVIDFITETFHMSWQDIEKFDFILDPGTVFLIVGVIFALIGLISVLSRKR